MTTTNKGGGSIPGSKNRFVVKPGIFVLQVIEVPRLPKVLSVHKNLTCATKQKNLLEYRPTWVLNSYWVVQYYQDPRARHFD